MNTFDPKKRSTFSFSFEEWKKNYNETPLKESVESEDEKTINFKDGINKYLKGAKLDGIVTVPDTFEDEEWGKEVESELDDFGQLSPGIVSCKLFWSFRFLAKYKHVILTLFYKYRHNNGGNGNKVRLTFDETGKLLSAED